jgi:hypothetical protein
MTSYGKNEIEMGAAFGKNSSTIKSTPTPTPNVKVYRRRRQHNVNLKRHHPMQTRSQGQMQK